MRIALDVMGGDHHPEAPVQGALSARRRLPASVTLVLVGEEEKLRQHVANAGGTPEDFEYLHATDVISMKESGSKAAVGKPESTIVKGMQAAAAGELDAFVSAGNTGAMLVSAVVHLGLYEGLVRPTVGALYPHHGRFSFICDVGANLGAKADALVQFGELGSIFMETLFGVQNPSVALLNVGEEPSKGTEAVQQAYAKYEENPRVNFLGNAEGWELAEGKADVFVCDGFVGNIILKYSEGLYPIFKNKLPQDEEVEAMNFEQIGGLPFLGVKGTVIVGHGRSGALAYENMLVRAEEIVRNQLNVRIQELLAKQA